MVQLTSQNLQDPNKVGFQVGPECGNTLLSYLPTSQKSLEIFECSTGWVGSRSTRSRWEKNQSHKPTTSWPNLQVRTCKIQAKLDSKLGPSVAINIQNQINQTKPYQTKPNQTKPKDLRMSYFCDLLLYSKLQILSLCENVFFSV